MLTERQARQLAALYNRATTYEVIATDGARRILVGYADRSRPRLRALLLGGLSDGTMRLHRVATMTGTHAHDWAYAPRAAAGFVCPGTAWRIVFSGRTRREVIMAGEPPESIY